MAGWNTASPNFDPAGGWAYSLGNTVAEESTTSNASQRADVGKSAGKWYWEIKAELGASGSTFDAFVGLIAASASVSTINAGSGSYSLRSSTGGVSGFTTGVGTFASGDVLCFAFDADAGKLWVRKNNGAWAGGGDPAAGTTPSATGLTPGTNYTPAVGADNSATNHKFTAKFGTSSFSYSPPSGFSPLAASYTFTGTVKNSSGAGVARTVRAHLRSDGSLVGVATSATDGSFTLPVTSSAEHYIVALDATENAVIYDHVTPITS